jgi:hypothetical protein
VVFLTDNNTTPTKVVLICFGLLVGSWQFDPIGFHLLIHVEMVEDVDVIKTKRVSLM